MSDKIWRMRGSLRVGGEAQCHRGTIGKIVSGGPPVYACVRAIVIVHAIAKQYTVENVRAKMNGCFGD